MYHGFYIVLQGSTIQMFKVCKIFKSFMLTKAAFIW